MTNLEEMGQKAQDAAFELGQLGSKEKNTALLTMADSLVLNTKEIVAANKEDYDKAKENGTKKAMLDRLLLTPDRINDMANGLRQVVELPDPIGKVDRGWQTTSGLDITQERVPLGVIGMIYEARPNVTVDAAGLCFKAGNAVILRGGKEAINSNIALSETLRHALQKVGINQDAVQLIDDVSHETAQKMMELNQYIDVLIPRGSGKFIKMVVDKAKVPIIETGAGNCHIYVDRDADLDKALKIIINAKVQRPSVCNAAEKVILHRDIANQFLPELYDALQANSVEVRGDTLSKAIVPDIVPATEEDWGTEYDDYIIAVKIVDSMTMPSSTSINTTLNIVNPLLPKTIAAVANS